MKAKGKTGAEEPNSGEELSEHDVDYYIHRFEEMEKDFKEIESTAAGFVESELKKSLGSNFDLMRQSKELTLRFLQDPNPLVRRAAIYIADAHWKLTAEIAQQCEQSALTEADIDARAMAIGALGSCYARMKDARVGHVLACIILDANEPIQIRTRAYSSLLRVHGNLLDEGRSPVDRPEEIDWPFVEQYRKKENAGP
jgi:hypothetical protein